MAIRRASPTSRRAPRSAAREHGNPGLALLAGSATIATNDNWSSGDAATMAASGGFSLTVGSRDAADVASLAAGYYTAVVSSVGNTTGTALVELYVLGAGSAEPRT